MNEINTTYTKDAGLVLALIVHMDLAFKIIIFGIISLALAIRIYEVFFGSIARSLKMGLKASNVKLNALQGYGQSFLNSSLNRKQPRNL